MPKIKKLELKWICLQDRRQFLFLDYIINGTSLFERIGRRRGVVSPFNTFSAETENDIRSQLLMETKSELPKSAVPLFVCAECGDLGCGAVCVCLEMDGEQIIWRELVWANNYEEECSPIEKFGPIAFDYKQYKETILSPPNFPL